MSATNQPAGKARAVTSAKSTGLDIKSLVLLAVLLAAGVAAMVMALIVNAGMRTRARALIPTIGTFVTTFLSGCMYLPIKMALGLND